MHVFLIPARMKLKRLQRLWNNMFLEEEFINAKAYVVIGGSQKDGEK